MNLRHYLEAFMNQNKLSFESENLVVDYISFKFQYLEDSTKTKLVNYLLKMGFNSIEQSRKLADPIQKQILGTSENKFHVTFDIDYPYWTLQISKQSATFFYQLVQKKSIDWKMFSSGILSRFDLYYLRANKPDDKISNRDFMHECKQVLEYSPRNLETFKTSTGVTLYIGNRKTDHSSRLYIKKGEEDFLKFE
nr:hypothetical protein [Naviculales sp.]